MTHGVIDSGTRAAVALLDHGYVISGESVYEEFGSGWVLLSHQDVRLRIVNDRGQWFIELGSTVAPEEWFDARLVLTEIRATALPEGHDEAALQLLCERLAETAAQWEVLFLRSTFDDSRKLLQARETQSARDRFGVDR